MTSKRKKTTRRCKKKPKDNKLQRDTKKNSRDPKLQRCQRDTNNYKNKHENFKRRNKTTRMKKWKKLRRDTNQLHRERKLQRNNNNLSCLNKLINYRETEETKQLQGNKEDFKQKLQMPNDCTESECRTIRPSINSDYRSSPPSVDQPL